MKRKFDLTDPKVYSLVTRLAARGLLACKSTEKFDEAVRPVYFHIPEQQHPLQTGSAVLVALRDYCFLFSAAHVYEPIRNYQILIGCGNQLHALSGDRFSSGRGPSGSHRDDNNDAAVVHIKGQIPTEIRQSCLSIDDLDLNFSFEHHFAHVLKGYRANQTRVSGNTARSKLDTFPSAEYFDRDYSQLGINRRLQAAIAFDEQTLVNGKWQPTPHPKGMSGGAIIRIIGVPVDPNVQPDLIREPKLTALITEYRPERKLNLPVIIGTRITYHLQLILRYLPDLKSWLEDKMAGKN